MCSYDDDYAVPASWRARWARSRDVESARASSAWTSGVSLTRRVRRDRSGVTAAGRRPPTRPLVGAVDDIGRLLPDDAVAAGDLLELDGGRDGGVVRGVGACADDDEFVVVIVEAVDNGDADP